MVRHQHYDGSFYYQLIDGNLKGRTSANSLLINSQKLQFHCLEHEAQIEFGSGVYAKYFIRNSTAIDPMVTDDEYILMGLILIDSAPSSQLEIISVTGLDAAATNALKSYL